MQKILRKWTVNINVQFNPCFMTCQQRFLSSPRVQPMLDVVANFRRPFTSQGVPICLTNITSCVTWSLQNLNTSVRTVSAPANALKERTDICNYCKKKDRRRRHLTIPMQQGDALFSCRWTKIPPGSHPCHASILGSVRSTLWHHFALNIHCWKNTCNNTRLFLYPHLILTCQVW